MICQIHHLNLEKSFIQPLYYQNFRHLCWTYWGDYLAGTFLLVQE